MVLYKFVSQRAFLDAKNVYNFVVGSFVKRSPELLSFIQTSSKFKVNTFAKKNLHHFNSFNNGMLVSSTMQSNYINRV